jgi:hypothetical protein
MGVYSRKLTLAFTEALSDRASRDIANYLILKSNPLVPYETGNAQASGHVSKVLSSGFTITYNPTQNRPSGIKSYGEYIYKMRNGRTPKNGKSDTFMDDVIDDSGNIQEIEELVRRAIQANFDKIK